MILLYNLIIKCYYFSIWIASFFNQKAKQWINGRKKIFEKLELIFEDKPEVIWVHCASLGEFEQGRPVIEALKRASRPTILLTFFSPSGYEIQKNYKYADYVCYLPLDTAANAERFLSIIQPKQIIFVKYEFWYHYLTIAQKRGIPTTLISALFRRNQFFFQWYARFFLKIIKNFTHIFVQDADSKQVLLQNGIRNAIVSGDTRVDRVIQIAENAERIRKIETFLIDENILVAGSTWARDEAILCEFIHQKKHQEWQFIIAPHEVDEAHIQDIEAQLKGLTVRFSDANKHNVHHKKVMIIDNIGMLSRIYQYAHVAYIGGGFGKGIHNILEPLVFGIPVVFGPNYDRFIEAKTLIYTQGVFSIDGTEAFNTVMKYLESEQNYNSAQKVTKQYIKKNQGATDKIMRYI